MSDSECREIGGYLELERTRGRVFHTGAIALNSGRSCIEYLVRSRGIESLWVPDFMCDAVYDICHATGVVTKVYRIGEDLAPVWDFVPADGEWLFLCDYYGQLTDATLEEARERFGDSLMVDETQGYFCAPRPGVDTLYSCRKFFGVPDGAFLYTTAPHDITLERDVSFERMTHVLGRLEMGSARFLDAARNNNDVVGEAGLRSMSTLTQTLLGGIDYALAQSARERNYEQLARALDKRNPISLASTPGPFAYPLLVSRGTGPAIRRSLASHGVFVPTLWPNVLEETDEGSVAYRYAHDILPLPVDQRYDSDDMAYILATLDSEGIA